MTDKLRLALAQANPTVGAIQANLALAEQAVADALAARADLLMFSELFLTGYFPDDLLFKPRFVADAMAAAEALAEKTRGTGLSVILPSIWQEGAVLTNSVLVLEDGRITARRDKHELPNDDVFYERRYFTAGPLPEPVILKGVPIGLPICEDIWHEDVMAHLAAHGSELLLCPNGSPYWLDKQATRYRLVRDRVAEHGLPLVYLNQVGGQDELVFDGASFAVEPGGHLVAQAKSFAPDFLVMDWHRTADGWRARSQTVTALPTPEEAPWQAAMLGLRDYVEKNGFKSVLFGLSGGIDSAVVAALAVDALGADRVHALMLPYHYTSGESLADAAECAKRLGIRYDVVPIAKPVEAALAELAPVFGNRAPDLTEENIQSRHRGVYLMAVSNKLGGLLLTTGNKSEMAVGYATLYGDMNGAFNPIKDMLKMRVYGLAEWRNRHLPMGALGPAGEVIPSNIITKAPSAELRPNQTDQDSLPPYPVLDALIEGIVEDELPLAEIVARSKGLIDLALARRIERLIRLAEYKRRQSPPGVKLTRKAFGLGRRYPITNGYADAHESVEALPPAISQGLE